MTIRVFVGCDPNGCDLESMAVLDYTLRKHASQQIELHWMRLSRDPTNPFYSDGVMGWRTDLWSTPFSGFRWAVPELCGFKGKAIYCDSDVIFQADVAELWEQKFQKGKVVLAKGGKAAWRFCVSLWDCETAASYVPHLPRLQSRLEAHRELVERFKGAAFVQPFKGQWNYCDNEDFGPLSEAKAIHYTDMSTQPSSRHAIPRLAAEGRKHWFDGPVLEHPRKEIVELFDRLLVEAEDHDFERERYMPPTLFGDYKKSKLTNYDGKKRAKGYRSHPVRTEGGFPK